MPLMKYFRSLRGKSRRGVNPGQGNSGCPSSCDEPPGPRATGEELQASQRFYADQETTRSLGKKSSRKGLRKHIAGIFTI
ncbi:MAG: hypothetical protein HOC20_01505 [Chloroflexi bacterium]|jgi:hypothetical protein|nr:hypothetical protein [Chloroflexota bacterium]